MEAWETAKAKLNVLGIKQNDLAERFGVEQPQISRALNGGNKTTLDRIINFLIEEHKIDKREFYPDDNERLANLEKLTSELKRDIKEIKKLLINQLSQRK